MHLHSTPWRANLSIFVVICLQGHVVAQSAAQTHPRIKTVMASWYGKKFAGNRTASGERFDPKKLTAAHPTLPLGEKVRVTNIETGGCVVVKINDRGPYFPGRGIDLSKAAAAHIGIVDAGVAVVQIEVLRP